MGSPGIQILKPSGGFGTLDPAQETTVKQALREVADGGWVVLKGSTKVTADSAQKDVVNNKVKISTEQERRDSWCFQFIQAILASARDGKYINQDFKHFQVKASDSKWGRSSNWAALAQGDGLAGFACIHLGGSDADDWVIELDMGLRGNATGNTTTVKANGTDM